uniref:Uncharacterized protein n=1 Tax=Molossus molossus TaxID=27622 RepID=A0A7J8B8J1_MOLMO|nr:hypothetical protein HJG59_010486 [Molossus molossus]
MYVKNTTQGGKWGTVQKGSSSGSRETNGQAHLGRPRASESLRGFPGLGLHSTGGPAGVPGAWAAPRALEDLRGFPGLGRHREHWRTCGGSRALGGTESTGGPAGFPGLGRHREHWRTCGGSQALGGTQSTGGPAGVPGPWAAQALEDLRGLAEPWSHVLGGGQVCSR